MSTKDILSTIDKEIGLKIRARRKELEFSLKDLAKWFDISYQQIQQYENGSKRISASLIMLFAQKLNVSPSYFLDDIECENYVNSQLLVKTRKTLLKILIIEDNSVDEMLLRGAITSSNISCQIHTEHNGIDAMEFMYGRKKSPNLIFSMPDIIVLDLNLPRKDGKSVLKSIKNSIKFKKIPVIILTNSVLKSDMDECYMMGASAFLIKSFDIKEFYQDIKKTLNYWNDVVILPEKNKIA